MNKDFYLDDYSTEDILKHLNIMESEKNILDTIDDNSEDKIEDYNSEDNNSEDNDSEDNKNTQKDKPSFTMKPNYNTKGEKVVVFSIKIPLKNNGLKIDILVNDKMYKNMGKYFKK